MTGWVVGALVFYAVLLLIAAGVAAVDPFRTRDPTEREGRPVVSDELSTSARLREMQGALAASQADLTRVERERDGVREELARQAAECEDLRHEVAHKDIEVGKLRAQLDHLRTGSAAALAELRGLAAFNRADAERFRHTSSPFGFGPTRAAEAYEKAVAIVEQKLGGESRG